MLFNSYGFILLFLPLAVTGYYVLNTDFFNRNGQGRAGMLYLAALSCWFCGYRHPIHLCILVFSIVCNYFVTVLLKRQRKPAWQKLCLAGGIVFHAGLLLVFKALNTFWGIPMPFGISFYTFGQIAYLVEFYRGEGRDYTFLEQFAASVFFPKLMQGPITYHSELIPQFRDKKVKKASYVNLSRGIYSFALGLAKKVLLADTLAKVVTAGYGNISELCRADAVLVMVCYSLQIYFDFSGYCDMAMGIAGMLNLQLPVNFHSPYKAVSVSDFWDRWHMTLTRFFTKYIYFPLGGSRKGKIRTFANILIVFLISGLWHGGNWTFLLWGLLNGLLMVFERAAGVEKWKLPKPVRQITAFILTTFAWSIFRADSIRQVWELWKRLAVPWKHHIYAPLTECFNELTEVSILSRVSGGILTESYPGLGLVLFVIILVIACFTMKNTQEKLQDMKFTAWKAVVTAGLLFWSILSLSEISTFIYVNF